MSGFTRGARDFLDLGTWNVYCARCGRKRKATEVVRHWTGTWMCPEHDEPRQPQDFARGIQERMDVPFVQPPLVEFTSLPGQFDSQISPAEITNSNLFGGDLALVTQSGQQIDTQSGQYLSLSGDLFGPVQVVVPSWVLEVDPLYPSENAVAFAWSWESGGVSISIVSPTAPVCFLAAASGLGALSGVLQCVTTSPTGLISTATAEVSVST